MKGSRIKAQWEKGARPPDQKGVKGGGAQGKEGLGDGGQPGAVEKGAGDPKQETKESQRM